eukprot:TRINITY_DN926_c0_g1_i1.p1 TRINITY_DN926_c0_g1~~TRINITY_DN926_c0_g1_i1.p1  ORF type:complete len:462 (+),score=99.97 TRINITY_DN926_c0_g1_i1:180-1565(+)
MGGEGGMDILNDWTDVAEAESPVSESVAELIEELPQCQYFAPPQDQQALTRHTGSSLASHSMLRLAGSLGDDSEEGRAEHERVKQELIKKREALGKRAANADDLREQLARYTPGAGLRPAGGKTASDYEIPGATTILLVGMMGAGKSTLVNNMIRVLNKRTSGFDRAQVVEQDGANGTYLLEEYSVCEESGKILVFDSRGLPSIDSEEGRSIIKDWLVNGVRHGQKVIRPSDSRCEKESLAARARQGHHSLAVKRNVNFVVLVVSAVSLDTMRKRDDLMAMQNLRRLCTSPFLSFKDDRPVVVMTQGDRLSPEDRIEARILLGRVMGVSPVDYVFDVAGYVRRKVLDEDSTSATDDMALLEMLEFALQRADRNLRYKPPGALQQAPLVARSTAVRIMEAYAEMPPSRKKAVWIVTSIWILSLLLLLALAFGFGPAKSPHGHFRHGGAKSSVRSPHKWHTDF